MKKTYILDTNILLESPNAIFGFADNTVAITTTTLQELDSKKNLHNDIGFNARETCRLLEAIREKGDLTTGVELDNGGKFMILQSDTSILPASYSKEKPDNQIIGTTLFAKANNPDENVILVTNDISMRINASACGLNQNVQAYKNDRIASDKETYLGRRIVETNNYAAMEKLVKEKTLELREFDDVKPPFIENEFLTIKCGNQSLLGIYQNGNINLIDSKKTHSFGITPKNVAQHFALHALLAPVDEIPFVILRGNAGTSKTFLSLVGGLDQVYNSKKERSYDRILISRNNVMADADFGYLPGDLEEKMNPLMAPFYDNLQSIIRSKNKDIDNREIQMQIEDMFETGIIEICPLAYMRGRSITNSYLIVDETQNATRSQIRDIITRAGQGTKVVICGDPNQIDNPVLDKWNNGLVFAAEKMKGSKLCAQITFDNSESVRSPLAKEGINRLV
jgi:PhoH-like ATPase